MARKRGKSHMTFKQRTAQFRAQGKRSPAGLAAYVGRKKYGKAGMARKAAAGRKKAAARRRRG